MKRKKCHVTRRKELFYYVTSGSNVTCDVHLRVTVDCQQIANDNIANQIHGFTIDYGKFILNVNSSGSLQTACVRFFSVGHYRRRFGVGKKVQPLTLLYTILAEKVPLLYPFY